MSSLLKDFTGSFRAQVAQASTSTRSLQHRLVVASAEKKRKQSTKKRVSKTAAVSADAAENGTTVLEKPVDTKVPSANINVIQPVSRWPTGVPPAMGGHYMPSGELAPLSKSKAPGVDIDPLYFTYPSGNADITVEVHDNDANAALGLAEFIANASANAIAAKGSFTLALSGGSLINTLTSLLDRSDIEFSKWYIFFVDERNVPYSSTDSTYGLVREELLRKLPIPSSHILAIKEGLPVDQAAIHYAGSMMDLREAVLPRTADGFPVLDLVLLGVGPDGHIASLFPNRKETAATTGWVLPVTESPKPPAERITLTMPVINSAKQVAVVAIGKGKAEITQRALEFQSLPGALPVQLVQPTNGSLTWIVDKAAANELRVNNWEEKKLFPRSTV